MTLWALLSDVHGRGDRLARVLADIQAQGDRQPGGARILALGDIAGPGPLSLLDRAGALCVFGNWEASGLRGLPPPYRSWVARWPAVLQVDGFLAAHASPVWPPNLTISGVVEHFRARNLHWTHLFPSLQHSESGRTAALAALSQSDCRIFFHGHTHVQEAWHASAAGEREATGNDEGAGLGPGGGGAQRVDYAGTEGGALDLVEDERWLVGVGSVGDPHDGPGAHYALYDSVTRRFTWRRV